MNIKIYFLSITFIIIVIMSGTIFAAPPEITANIDKDLINVGDIIEYKISVKSEKNQGEILPSENNIPEDFEVLDFSETQKDLDKEIIVNYIYKISIYSTGEFELPPVELTYKYTDGNEEVLSTGKSLPIKVESILPEDAKDIKDIKSPVAFKNPFPYWLLLIILASILVLIILFYTLRWIYRKYFQKSEAEEIQVPLLPPDKEAYKALEELASSDLFEEGKIKEYYIQLADILRRYLERGFIILTFEKTSDEILYQIKSKLEDKNLVKSLSTLLGEFDLVKFAKLKPSISEGRGHILKTRNFIESTAHQEEDKPSTKEKEEKEEEK